MPKIIQITAIENKLYALTAKWVYVWQEVRVPTGKIIDVPWQEESNIWGWFQHKTEWYSCPETRAEFQWTKLPNIPDNL